MIEATPVRRQRVLAAFAFGRYDGARHMPRYDHQSIERKWQERWATSHAHEARDPEASSGRAGDARPKEYLLVEFPYPSGDGLHVGHIRPYVALDVIARKHRMEGKNVLYPIGWDAFGLPTENYAIKMGIHPAVATKQNTDRFRRQIQSLGISFDWSREVNTTDPAYYKWTQWIFLQFLKHGLAHKARMPINWCTRCKIGLANEEVVGGVCERCGGAVEKRDREQMEKGTLPRVSWEKIIEHIDHVVKLVGPDHVGLGSDFDGASMPLGLDDVSKLSRITQALLDKGYRAEDVEKILGGNLLQVMEETESVSRSLSGR